MSTSSTSNNGNSIAGQRPPLTFQPASNVRHWVIAAMTFAAFLMYLDRLCLAQIVSSDSFMREFNFDDATVEKLLSVFFGAYAFSQVPAGWLADRFGARVLMTIYIAIWSAFTLLTGFAMGFWTLVVFRFGCAMAEAGAYPSSSKIVSRWIPVISRGWSSSLVAGGGRVGGAIAPILTAWIVLTFGNWRAAGWIYGAAGILFAAVFWRIVRDRPADHSAVNDAERDLIQHGLPPEQAIAPPTTRKFPILGLIRNRSMWFMSANQFFSNLGWVFLATLVQKYLRQAKGLTEHEAGEATTIALTIGITGMFMGGWVTDAMTRRFGTIRGRMIPLAVPRFIGAGAYLLCLLPVPLWAIVGAFAVVAMTADLAVPPTWAYCQDVGGRNAAACLAWPNMWGNIGAMIGPLLLGWINKNFDPHHDWHASLLVMSGALVVCGLTAFWIRADKKIEGTDGDEGIPPGFPVVLPAPQVPVPAEG